MVSSARCRFARPHLIKEVVLVGVDSVSAALALMAHLKEPLVWLLMQSVHRKLEQVTQDAVGVCRQLVVAHVVWVRDTSVQA